MYEITLVVQLHSVVFLLSFPKQTSVPGAKAFVVLEGSMNLGSGTTVVRVQTLKTVVQASFAATRLEMRYLVIINQAFKSAGTCQVLRILENASMLENCEKT